MDLNILSKMLKYTCNLHQSQPLNIFCKHDECQNKGLICSLCEQTNHIKHKPVSFKYLLNQIFNDFKTYTQGKDIIKFTAVIDEQYMKSTSLIQKIKRMEERKTIKQSVNRYFQRVRQIVLKPNAFQFLRLYEIIKEKKLQINQVNNFFLNYKIVDRDQNQTNIQNSNYQLSVLQLVNDLKSKYEQMQKFIKIDEKLQNLLQIYVFAETEQKIAFSFSQTLKHTSHTITNKNLIVQKNNYNTNFALIQPSIETNKKSSKLKSIHFKITRLTSWITLGVCHQNIVKTANFYFNTGNIGHGGYVVSNDSYSWHHTTSTLNSFYNGWSFAQGDTVHLTWNPKTKSVKYTKNEQSDGYELQCDTIPGDKLYFCVSLSSHDQSVEII